MDITPLEHFETKFIPEPNTGCWLWLHVLNRDGGYGQLGGRREKAHRVSYKLYCGPIPEGMLVLHRCDQPCCVNPEHLFLGTSADNMADKKAKGRASRCNGQTNGQAKLTEDNVRSIRADVRSQSTIAAQYGVSATTISEIKRRVWWKHI